MAESRVQVIGEEEFNEREWLRREVLWASLILPYSHLMKSWLDGIEYDYYASNISRRDLFSSVSDVEYQSKAFLNHGKAIASIVASATLFSASINKSAEGAYVDALEVQAKSVDKALGRLASRNTVGVSMTDEEAYKECTRLAMDVAQKVRSDFAKNGKLRRAANIMATLASKEAAAWIENSKQNEEQSLPILTIPNGGTPRSGGPRVEKLQPIFHQIVNSERYQAL